MNEELWRDFRGWPEFINVFLVIAALWNFSGNLFLSRVHLFFFTFFILIFISKFPSSQKHFFPLLATWLWIMYVLFSGSSTEGGKFLCMRSPWIWVQHVNVWAGSSSEPITVHYATYTRVMWKLEASSTHTVYWEGTFSEVGDLVCIFTDYRFFSTRRRV